MNSGPIPVAQVAWASVKRRLPHVERLVVFRSPATLEGVDAVADAGFVLREASEAGLDDLRHIRRPHQIDPLRTLLRSGVRGWMAYAGERAAGHAFLLVSRERPHRHGGVWLHPGEMAITAMFVSPEFRGRGLGGALHRQLVSLAVRDAGSTTNVAWTADYNTASQRMLTKLGCEPVGTIRRLIVWHRPVLSSYRGAPPRR